VAVVGSPQILSEFAAESDLGGRLSHAPSWRTLGAVLIAALVATGIAAVWFSSFVNRSAQFDASMLPPRPAWSSIQAPLPKIEMIATDGPNYGSYAIQVAAFFTRSRADRVVTELTAAGFRVHIVEVDLRAERAVMSLVRVEGYRSPEEAAGDLARIRQIPSYGDAHIVSNDSAAVRNSLPKQPPPGAN
jgi:cell division septation protein DedD